MSGRLGGRQRAAASSGTATRRPNSDSHLWPLLFSLRLQPRRSWSALRRLFRMPRSRFPVVSAWAAAPPALVLSERDSMASRKLTHMRTQLLAKKQSHEQPLAQRSSSLHGSNYCV